MNATISCYTNNYGPSGVWVAVEQVRQAGLDHLELALRGHNFGGLVIPESVIVTEKADDATAQSFVDHLAKQQVKVSGCNVGGADIRTRDGVELTLRRMEFASRWFGVPVVVSGAGQPTNEAERALVIAHLRELGDRAEALGLTIALETHKGPTQNADAMLQLMDEVDHVRVRLNFDTGNIAYYNPGADPVRELERVKHLVRNVHLKDNRGGLEDWYFPAIGEGGSVNFSKIREILESVQFNGVCTIEIEGIGGEAEPGLEERQARISRSVVYLRRCGFLPPATE